LLYSGDKSPLCFFSKKIIPFALNLGLDPNEQDAQGNTPLTYFVSLEKTKKIKILLEHGADQNRANFKGSTPLRYALAAKKPNLDLIELLLGKEIDFSLYPKVEKRLYKQCMGNGDFELLKKLIKRSYDNLQ
jgi:ankyrin repeat protein